MHCPYVCKWGGKKYDMPALFKLRRAVVKLDCISVTNKVDKECTQNQNLTTIYSIVVGIFHSSHGPTTDQHCQPAAATNIAEKQKSKPCKIIDQVMRNMFKQHDRECQTQTNITNKEEHKQKVKTKGI